MKILEEMGVRMPKVLLPKELDTKTWAVIACDQYTQDKKYWLAVEKAAAQKPSALHIILPEIYLNDQTDRRIKTIHDTMKSYI